MKTVVLFTILEETVLGFCNKQKVQKNSICV